MQGMETSGDKIALLNIDGVIMSSSPRNYWSTDFNTDMFIESLRKAGKDNSVKAILIRINSPGGITVFSSFCHLTKASAPTSRAICCNLSSFFKTSLSFFHR